jgi:hypothetical protein
MPRDGLQQYAPPPGTQGVANYTVESARYNTFVADITADQNNPRPIVAGGTGAANAHDAMVALSGEITNQVVTNYDSWPFVSGSFSSAPGATSAPVAGHTFIGYSYGNNANNAQTVEARDLTDGKKYVRNMVGGVWGAWQPQGTGSVADLDAAYVNVAGDTMTGRLDITMPDPIITLNKTAGAHGNTIYGTVSAVPRWAISPGNSSPESSGNAGSDFGLSRFSDAGAFLGTSLGIVRATGAAQFESSIAAGIAGTTGTYYFGNSGTKYLNYDGTNYTLNGGLFVVNAGIVAAASGTTGAYYFGNTSKYLSYDGTNYTLLGGNLYVGAAANYGTLSCGDLTTSRAGAPTTGYHFFGNSGAKYIGFDGSGFQTVGGTFNVNGALVATADIYVGYTTATGTIRFANDATKYLSYNGGNYVLNSGELNVNSVPGGYANIRLASIGSGAPASLRLLVNNVELSSVSDNGSSFNMWSNAAQSTGMYLLHGGSSWNAISDARLPYKKTARPLSVLDRIDKVYLYENEVNDRLELFVKAQEFNEAFPHLVIPGSGPDDRVIDEKDIAGGGVVWGVSYDRAGVAALQGLKELKEMVAVLRAEIADLKAKR